MYYQETFYDKYLPDTPLGAPLNLPKGQQVNINRSSSQLNNQLASTHNSQFVYVDCIFNNEISNDWANIVFNASRNVPILDERYNYKLGVISINGFLAIPLLHDEGPLTFEVTYTLADFDYKVTYTTPPLGSIFNINQYVDFMNTQLTVLWDGFKIDFTNNGGNINDPGFPINPPGLTFDPTNQLFTIYADAHMQSDSPPNNIFNVFLDFDYTTDELLWGLDVQSTTQVVGFVNFVPGYHNSNLITYNGDDYIKNTQDSPSVGNWHKANALVLVSDNLGARKVEVSTSSSIALNSGNTILNIVDTFPINFTGFYNRFSLFANPNINFCDIVTTGELTELNFSLYILTRNGNIQPLLAPPSAVLVVRLVFAKTLFTSN